MTLDQWKVTLDSARAEGVEMVQFIGGEPTLHPDLPALVNHALALGLKVEVFSNLVSVSERLWEVLDQPGVSLATSYYSSVPAEHELITTRESSYAKTRRNIAAAVARGIPLRVGIIGILKGQHATEARQELLALGVPEEMIGYDEMRGVGRGAGERPIDDVADELCGRCADSVAAVLPDGRVQPCVFSRQPQFTIGNLKFQTLGEVVRASSVAAVRGTLQERFMKRSVPGPTACNPHNCYPHCFPSCEPNCGPSCSPSCHPTRSCRPDVGPPY